MKALVFFDNYEVVEGNILNIRRMIFEYDGKFFFVADEVEKITDIMSMPDYIRIDWVNYNKYDLKASHIDYISNLVTKLPILVDGKVNEDREIILQTLKSIRRDLAISSM